MTWNEVMARMRDSTFTVHCADIYERRDLLLRMEEYGFELDYGCNEIAHDDIYSIADALYIYNESSVHGNGCVHSRMGAVCEYCDINDDEVLNFDENFDALF